MKLFWRFFSLCSVFFYFFQNQILHSTETHLANWVTLGYNSSDFIELKSGNNKTFSLKKNFSQLEGYINLELPFTKNKVGFNVAQNSFSTYLAPQGQNLSSNLQVKTPVYTFSHNWRLNSSDKYLFRESASFAYGKFWDYSLKANFLPIDLINFGLQKSSMHKWYPIDLTVSNVAFFLPVHFTHEVNKLSIKSPFPKTNLDFAYSFNKFHPRSPIKHSGNNKKREMGTILTGNNQIIFTELSIPLVKDYFISKWQTNFTTCEYGLRLEDNTQNVGVLEGKGKISSFTGEIVSKFPPRMTNFSLGYIYRKVNTEGNGQFDPKKYIIYDVARFLKFFIDIEEYITEQYFTYFLDLDIHQYYISYQKESFSWLNLLAEIDYFNVNPDGYTLLWAYLPTWYAGKKPKTKKTFFPLSNVKFLLLSLEPKFKLGKFLLSYRFNQIVPLSAEKRISEEKVSKIDLKTEETSFRGGNSHNISISYFF